MSIKTLLQTLQQEREDLLSKAQQEPNRLARHCLKHRAHSLVFEAECLTEVIKRFGEHDESELLALYDKLYVIYREEADDFISQAKEFPSGIAKEKLILKACDSQRKYRQLSQVISLNIVRGHIKDTSYYGTVTNHPEHTVQPMNTHMDYDDISVSTRPKSRHIIPLISIFGVLLCIWVGAQLTNFTR